MFFRSWQCIINVPLMILLTMMVLSSITNLLDPFCADFLIYYHSGVPMNPDPATLQTMASTPVCIIGTPILFVHSLLLSFTFLKFTHIISSTAYPGTNRNPACYYSKACRSNWSKHSTNFSMRDREKKFIKAFRRRLFSSVLF